MPAYLWHDESGTTLIDTGPPGSGAAIKAAMEQLGLLREELRRIVLTHFHNDHTGSAAELAGRSGAEVVVGVADAAFVRGDVPGPPPALTPAEQQLHAVVAAGGSPRRSAGSTGRSPMRMSWSSAARLWCCRCRATPRGASPFTCSSLACC